MNEFEFASSYKDEQIRIYQLLTEMNEFEFTSSMFYKYEMLVYLVMSIFFQLIDDQLINHRLNRRLKNQFFLIFGIFDHA